MRLLGVDTSTRKDSTGLMTMTVETYRAGGHPYSVIREVRPSGKRHRTICPACGKKRFVISFVGCRRCWRRSRGSIKAGGWFVDAAVVE